MDTRELLLTIHLLAAIVWIGGSFMIQIFATRAKRSTDPEALARISREAEFVGQRTFIPASLLLVLTGFGLVAEVNYDWEFWIVFALAGWTASFLAGAFFLGPQSGKVGQLIEAQGAGAAAVREKIGTLFLVSRIELVLLFAIVVVMVTKPGL